VPKEYDGENGWPRRLRRVEEELGRHDVRITGLEHDVLPILELVQITSSLAKEVGNMKDELSRAKSLFGGLIVTIAGGLVVGLLVYFLTRG